MSRFLLWSTLMTFFCAGVCFGTWVEQNSGTTMDLNDVWFKRPPSGRGWAVGDSGTIVSTTNMGTNWTLQTCPTPELLYGVAWDLKYVGMKEWATAVGGRNYPGVGVHTTNGGSTWTAIPWTYQHACAISYGDSLNGWAVGVARVLYKTTNGGQSWAIQDSGGALSDWFGVWFVNDRIGWACGEHSNISKTIDGGANWVIQYEGLGGYWYGISFRDSLQGCVVGQNGRIWRTTNGGVSWDTISTGYTDNLYGVFLSCYGSTGYAVGGNGRILATSNSGASWVAEPSGVTQTLRGVWCWLDMPGLWAFAVGDSGTILYQFISGDVEEQKSSVDRQEASVRICPNPFHSFASVANHERELFAVYDATGNMLGTYRGDRIGQGLKPGVYFVKVNGKVTQKIIKVR